MQAKFQPPPASGPGLQSILPTRVRPSGFAIALPSGCALVLGTLASVIVQLAPPAAQAADGVRQIEMDVDNMRNGVGLIESDLGQALARERRHPIEKRFFEATMAYERGNVTTAAVLLMDLVQNPEFQVTRDHGDGLFMLGDCLFRMRNYAGAKRYLDQVLKLPANRNFQSALQELADIAVRLHRMEDVEAYAEKLATIPPSQRRSELIYQFGRSFFSARAYDRARTFLDQIPVGEKRWPNARFYVGALLVAQSRPDDAIKEFQGILDAGKATDAARKPEQAVLDYANIALARLYLQKKKYDEAVSHYQKVDRNSTVYEEALFELAATFVAAQKPQRALESLDVLLLTVSDDNVAVQAAVLRGRINMIAKAYDQADAAYQDVVERYSAITQELNLFASSDKNLEQFFSWLLNRSSDEYTVVRPVSERVQRYIERDEDMLRVVALFDEMSGERRDVKESARLAATIDAALKETSRLDMFPELKDGWLRVTESQHQSVALGARILRLLAALAAPSMTGEELVRAKAMQDDRAKWDAALKSAPATKGAIIEREQRIDSGYANQAAEIGILHSNLSATKDQVLAIEKMLNDRVFGGPEQGNYLPKERESEYRTTLQAEKDALRQIYRSIDDLGQDVEVYAQGVGAGDKVSGDEGRVRATLLAKQRAEQAFYSAVLERGTAKPEDITRLKVARNHIETLNDKMGTILATIALRAGERIAVIAGILAQEKRNIAEYQVTVRSYEEDARSMAREVGYGLIRNVGARLADIVLEADLGLVDVAWQRKMEKTTAIRELQDERATRIRSLGEVLENLTVEPEGGAE